MAVTADTVEVRLRADTVKYIKDIKSAEQLSSAEFAKIESEVEALGRQIGASMAAGGAGVTGFAKDVQQSAGSLRVNTANIAAQFQDIGVTAAMGMNPLQIALQQGTQLSAVLNESVSRGVSPVKALGGAFIQLINPISLATIAAIALGSAVLQSIGSILPETETANEAIKRHREALEGIVEGYSSAEDAVKSYFDAASRLPQGVATLKTREQFAELGEEVEKFRQQAAQVGATFTDFGSTAERRLGEIARQFSSGAISAEEFYLGLEDARSELNFMESALSSISVGRLIDEMQVGAEKALAFGNAINNLVAASMALSGVSVDPDLQNALDLNTYIAEQERLNGLTGEQLSLEKEIARIKSQAGEFGISDQRALELAEQTLAAEKRRADIKKELTATDRSGTKAANEYERERKAVVDLLDAMGLQAAMLGQSNREKAIAIALSKANKTATEDELNAISQTAGFIYDTEQAIKQLNETSAEWATTIQSATSGFIDDLIEGKSAAEAFGNVLSNIGSKLIDMGLNSIFGTGGFNLAGLFGGSATRATGGSVYSGNPTLVGEKGPEMFIPSGPGKIVPNSQLGGGSVTFAPVIDARGADVAAIARLERVVQDMATNIVPTIRREIAVGPKKGR